ncbi:MAG: helix-turn-helix domain-containing protein [Nanoarchaeota archaeon]|nr:helix-turn-helix domain-containing protein [Nanoarchaeota archaeon]
MAKKDTFLLVSLQDDQAKEVAQIITNKTCRKMLDFLAANEEVTETQISKVLKLPISTVHYNLGALKKAKLVESEEFHYSAKGKEVAHYKLANKYIIIAPKSTHGIKSKLRSILPVGILTVAAAFFIQIFSKAGSLAAIRPENYKMVAEEAAVGSAGTATSVSVGTSGTSVESALNTAPQAVKVANEVVTDAIPRVAESIWQSPVLWFIIGAVFAIGLYFLIEYIRRKKSK